MTKQFLSCYAIALLMIIAGSTLQAQTVSKTDSLLNAVNKRTVFLENLKLSGYVQTQLQFADSQGIRSFAGGNFEPGVDKRFMVRQGRLKVVYETKSGMYYVQINVNEKGVTIKDAFLKFKLPWTKWLAIQAGIYNRPFGFEIPFSSSNRESPERSRLEQTLFPQERDLGAELIIEAPSTSKLKGLKVEAGMYNGAGQGVDFDFQKDFMGRLSYNKSLSDNKIKFGIGVSTYNGGVRQSTKKIYTDVMQINDSTVGYMVDSTITNLNEIATRQYMGADVQFSYTSGIGTTTLRGEFIQGIQPGTSSSNMSPVKDPAADTYIRNFNGAYFYFIQGFMKDKHQLVFKYDFLDPNTDVAGNEIGQTGSKLGLADLKFSTIGIGYIWNVDKQLKCVVYYDVVTNETSANLGNYANDLKDNVVTFRIQYRFP